MEMFQLHQVGQGSRGYKGKCRFDCDSVKADTPWTYNWFPVLLHNDRSENSISSDYNYKEQDVGEGGDGVDPAGSPVAHGEGGGGHSEV